MEIRELKRIHANAETETNQICKAEKVYFLEERKIKILEKNDFAKFKNLARYKFENNFVVLLK